MKFNKGYGGRKWNETSVSAKTTHQREESRLHVQVKLLPANGYIQCHTSNVFSQLIQVSLWILNHIVLICTLEPCDLVQIYRCLKYKPFVEWNYLRKCRNEVMNNNIKVESHFLHDQNLNEERRQRGTTFGYNFLYKRIFLLSRSSGAPAKSW